MNLMHGTHNWKNEEKKTKSRRIDKKKTGNTMNVEHTCMNTTIRFCCCTEIKNQMKRRRTNDEKKKIK